MIRKKLTIRGHLKLLVFAVCTFAVTSHSYAQQRKWTLQMCIDTAIVNNIDLQRSENNIRISEVNLRQSKDNQFPTLNAGISQNFNSGRSVDPYSYQYVNNNISSNNISLNSSLIIFNGFQNRNSIRQNKINVQASEFDALEIQNDVVLSVLNAYLQLLYAHEQTDLAEKQVATSLIQVSQTKSLLRAGKKTETDLLKLESQLAGDSLTLVQSLNTVRVAKLNLAQVINIPVNEELEFEIIEAEKVQLAEFTTNLEELYEKSLEVMPEVKSSKLNTESAEVGMKIARAGALPRLSLSAGISSGYSSARSLTSYEIAPQSNAIGYVKDNPSQVVISNDPVLIPVISPYPFANQINDNLNKYISLNLSVPILNNRQTKNNTAIQKINIENAELNEENVKRNLRKEVEQAYIDMVNSKANYEASVKQLGYAKKSYENVQSKYTLGVSSSADLQLEFNNYMKAQSAMLQSKYQYLFNLKMLDLYQGKNVSL